MVELYDQDAEPLFFQDREHADRLRALRSWTPPIQTPATEHYVPPPNDVVMLDVEIIPIDPGEEIIARAKAGMFHAFFNGFIFSAVMNGFYGLYEVAAEGGGKGRIFISVVAAGLAKAMQIDAIEDHLIHAGYDPENYRDKI